MPKRLKPSTKSQHNYHLVIPSQVMTRLQKHCDKIGVKSVSAAIMMAINQYLSAEGA